MLSAFSEAFKRYFHSLSASSGDPYKYTHLHTLLAQCQRSSLPTLVPSFTCLLPPGGMIYTLIAGKAS